MLNTMEKEMIHIFKDKGMKVSTVQMTVGCLKTEEQQKKMLEFLKANPSATVGEIVDEQMYITGRQKRPSQKKSKRLPTLEEMRARRKRVLETYEEAEEEFGAV